MITINIFALLYTVICAYHDSLVIKASESTHSTTRTKFRKAWHMTGAVKVAMVSLVVSILFLFPTTCGIPSNILELAALSTLVLLYRLLLFNYILNFFMGWVYSYYSDSSVIDRITNKYIPKNFINLLIIFIIIALNIYFNG